MKIAYIICTFPPYKGGMGNSVYHSALELSKLGHEIFVFTPSYPGIKPGVEIIFNNIKIVRLKPWFFFGNAAFLPQLFYLLKGFDIVNLHYPFYGAAEIIALLSIFKRVNLVIHYHMDSVASGFKGFIFKIYSFLFLPIIVRLSLKITCASLDYIKHSELSDFYANHQDKFIEIPFGVDAVKFYPKQIDKESIVLFVGGLDSQHYFKGVSNLIIAFKKVIISHPQSKLILIGRGNLEKYYYDLAYKQGIDNNFKVINKVINNELTDWYSRAKVLVLPSINKGEAFGLVLLEAMACATPVIASNLPGVRNVFKNKEHGFLVKPGDVEILAEKINYLLSNENEALAMGLSARKYIEQRYSWEKVGETLEAAYLRILYTAKK